MDDARNTKKIRQANLHKKKQPKVRSRARWKDEEENDIRKMGIVNWRHVAHDSNRWRTATGEPLILLGWRRRRRRRRAGGGEEREEVECGDGEAEEKG
jgi:hypothetical protein